MKRKIVVAHPLQQHSYKPALALNITNDLFAYITTVYYQKGRLLLEILGRILSRENVVRMKGRNNPALDKYIIRVREILGLIYLFTIRFDRRNAIRPLLYKILVRSFGISVCKYIEANKVDAVIMYDTTAYECFKRLNNKKNRTIKILDMSSAAAPYIREILIREINKNTPFNASLNIKLRSYSINRCNEYLSELKNCDYFLAPCLFVKRTLLFCGIREDRIIQLPLGVDTNMFPMKDYRIKKSSDKLKLLFVGRVEPGKGIYYLLEAIRALSDFKIEMTVVGSIYCNMEELRGLNENVIFAGSKMKTEMPAIYQNADVLIAPSLWEGFGFTILEAMSSGVPVIGSRDSAAETILTNFKDGFVIDPCSVKEIVDKIIWFNNNRQGLSVMGRNARLTAEKYSWKSYEKNITVAIRTIINIAKRGEIDRN